MSEDENKLIAERREKLRGLRAGGIAFPERFQARYVRRRSAGRIRRRRALERRSDRECEPPRARCRPHHGQAHHGQGELRADPGLERPHAALPAAGHARRCVRCVQGLGRRRHRRRRRHADAHEDRRAFGQGRCAAADHEIAAAAAGQVAWPFGRRAALSAALCRSDRHARVASRVRAALGDDPLHAPVARGRAAAFHGSRDADDASDPRRRDRAAVRDASQRARSRHVPARRAGAVSQAPRRRRLRARLRDQPEFPQRGRVDAAQPRVHDARALPGVRDVHRDHGSHRSR